MSCSRRTFLATLSAAFAQDSPPDVFSGTVVAFSEKEIVVSRSNLARKTETKKFAMDENTKVEGKIKVKARVSVQFVVEDEAMRAIHIIVR